MYYDRLPLHEVLEVTMKSAIKGALFSGLVFPGLGQMVLKQKMRGAIIVLAVLTCLYFLVMKIMETAMAIVADVQSQGGIVNVANVADTATRLTTESAETSLNLLLILILICWIASTIDAYRIGKRLDEIDVK